ncbi:MAG: trypsin-like peptidase domain-containing protein [Lyngbya sp. HA4199-MV5]|jgi:S1-C subfamily serine protease|nr:trypsin-like peptidase domain-containing protein [Lyngbya sp. HA4199-MV5]
MARPLSHKFARFAASGLLAVQAAITTTVISEFTLSTPGITTAGAAQAQDANEIYPKVAPAVVYIKTDRGTGSGVVIKSNGLIVTNAHVVAGVRDIQVELQDGRKLAAEVVSLGDSKCLDLAVLKVQASNLPTIKFAATGSVQKGQRAFTVGYPRGLKPSAITQGIVSNIYNEFGLIQMDAAIIPGNSGGALVNDRGELVGITTKKGVDENTGMNLAVATDKVQTLLQAYQQKLSPTIGRYLIPVSQSASQPLAQTLELGKTQQGQLRSQGNLVCADQSRANLYTFEGKADQPVMISMSSAAMGSYLMLLGPDGQLLGRDSSGGVNQNALVVAKLPQQGTYTVIANSEKGSELGRYQINTSTPLLFERGSVNANEPERRYTITGKAGQAIAVSLLGFEFDPYLTLTDANGGSIAQGKLKRQETVTAKFPKDGVYTLTVRTVKPGDRGKFALLVLTQPTTAPNNQITQR